VKILIINYFLPPVGTSHAYRWLRLARYFSEKGVEVDFYTSKSNLRNIDDFPFEIKEIGFNTNRQIEKTSKANEKKTSGKTNKLLKFLLWLYRKTYWPDGLWYWLPSLLKSLWKARNEKYDLVVSYSPTFSCHVGALFFNTVTSNKIKWISDYGDPFSISDTMPPNNFYLYNKLNNYIEAKVIKGSYKVSFTNEKTLESYNEKFISDNKCVIPHYVSVDDYYLIKEDSSQYVRYIGALHKNIREANYVLGILDEIIGKASNFSILNALSFEFYGPKNGVEFSSKNIEHLGVLNKKDADEKIKSSSILINIENNNCVMSPSKVVEYLATGLPVVNFYSSEISELFVKAEYSDCRWVLNVNEETDKKKIVEFIENSISYQKNKKEVCFFLRDLNLDGVANMILSWVKCD
jgi:glycosyltransferase involved in cell wall biosynthesis